MRSIRLSLILSFLLLLVVALGGMSWFAYQTAYRTLEEKETSTRALIQTEYERRVKHAEEELDNTLLQRAYLLASTASYIDRLQDGLVLYATRLFQAGTALQPSLTVAAWRIEAEAMMPGKDLGGPGRNRVERVAKLYNFVSIEYPEEVLSTLASASPYHGHFLVYNSIESKLLEHSPLVPDELTVLDRTLRKLMTDQRVPYVFDDPRLEGGERMRRVTLKTVVERQKTFLPPRPGGWGGGPRGKGPKQPPPPKQFVSKQPPRPFERRAPTLFVQYVASTADLNAKLAGIAADRDERIQEQGVLAVAQLEELRDRMWWLGLIAFIATGAGGFVLLHLGLKPLSRLSDAVSRISEKDFRLPLDGAPLPSELRPIEERLQQTLDQLKRAFAREKQAAADISHELRTPLAALMTTLDVALRKPRSPEEYREILVECRGSGKHMAELVERLLALARLDAGADLLRPREVDAAALAEQCAAMVRPLAEAHGLQLKVCHNGDARVKTDPDKLREVLNNLLHNAVQYNRPHGSIDLEVRRDNGTLELEVRDTGIGIAPQAREHIFERFFRADPSRHTDGLNAGLGLAIVKGYVDLLGGTIRVDSTEGQGSAFRVRLPARAEGFAN